MAPELPQITTLGETNFRGQHRKFGIYTDDRRRHLYVVGKTGVGKTTFLENMIAQDIVNGNGVCLVDPHGDAAERMLSVVPPHRVNDVVYFDPSDVSHPIAFNVLEAVDPTYKYLVASGLVSSLKKIWADSWGPRLEYILRNTILALLDYPSSTILGILRMLADKDYRKKVVAKINDPVVKGFWTNEFANYNERFRSEAISPIQNKVGQFLSSAIIRNIVAQPKSTIDMKDIMDNGKILLINVSKGKIGEDNSALLGAMLINRIQLAAMDRANIPEEQRRDFYLYVDEFQNFATESFADILSEARKYHLNLTIAHQYINQMEEPVRDAVFGNVGTLVSFRVGAFDADFMEAEFAPTFSTSSLVNLSKYNAYIKLMIDGITSRPFSMRTVPPDFEDFGRADIVKRVSQERYGRPRELVEAKIARWSGIVLKQEGEASQGERAASPPARQPKEVAARSAPATPKPAELDALQDVVLSQSTKVATDLTSLLQSDAERRGMTKKSAKSEGSSSRTTYPIVCSRCEKEATVPFEPDPKKPVYCKSCLEIVKKEKKKTQGAAKKLQVVAPALPPARQFTGPRPPR